MITNYKDLAREDVISKLKPWLDKGALFLRDDGKITKTNRLAHNSPWIHTKLARNRNCGLWHLYHQAFGFIHSTCQECWKVVVRPRTLVELHKLLDLQKLLDLPSKCGIERRDTVHGLYGGYFYNDSIEQGRECYKLVRENVSHNISPDVPVILKRGCTEFEVGGTPSDQWEISEEQKDLEYLLLDLMDQDVTASPQPEHVKQSVFRSWIHWAYGCGDPTYAFYTDGEPLFKPYVTYHQEIKNEKEKHSPASSKRKGKPKKPVSAKTKTKTK